MPKILHDGVIYDSGEEVEFLLWLHGAKSLGLVIKWIYQPSKYVLSEKITYPVIKQLKTKTKTITKTLLLGHDYTPDFRVYFTNKFIEEYPSLIWTKDYCADVDVKGTFNQNDAWRRFSIDQKWVYQKYAILVNKVIPEKFFKLTFVPDEIAFQKRNKTKRIKRFTECKLLSELRKIYGINNQ